MFLVFIRKKYYNYVYFESVRTIRLLSDYTFLKLTLFKWWFYGFLWFNWSEWFSRYDWPKRSLPFLTFGFDCHVIRFKFFGITSIFFLLTSFIEISVHILLRSSIYSWNWLYTMVILNILIFVVFIVLWLTK